MKVLTDYEITVESFKWPRPYIVPIWYEESILAFSLIDPNTLWEQLLFSSFFFSPILKYYFFKD